MFTDFNEAGFIFTVLDSPTGSLKHIFLQISREKLSYSCVVMYELIKEATHGQVSLFNLTSVIHHLPFR